MSLVAEACLAFCNAGSPSVSNDEENLPDIPGMVSVTLRNVKVVKGDNTLKQVCNPEAADAGLLSASGHTVYSDDKEAVGAMHMPGQLPPW